MSQAELKREEQVVYALRNLYETYGYAQYKMSKFEEYDLYVRNKDFLISDSVITFTDTNGKLLALKPDVTLSIIKNGEDNEGTVQKVYYTENVYRVSKGTGAYQEIMQVGLECVGDIDGYCLYEVVRLAAESLRRISDESILAVSHLGVLAGVLADFGLSEQQQAAIGRLVGEKNLHELTAVCAAAGLTEEQTAVLQEITALSGRPSDVLARLRAMPAVTANPAPIEELAQLTAALEESGCGDSIRIDFSVVSDSKYYNGVVFKGFVKGAPTDVLSGGQYDRLLERMGRTSGAVGFAVYMDALERLWRENAGYDVDTVLLYSAADSPAAVRRAVEAIAAEGCTVTAQRSLPDKLICRRVMRLCGNEVQELETDA
ncbi:MAG: ATP phosphoribosyltransferase regulatory subunit [Clostridia bacterium]|nr:ATP phosphoribosyltransferase regulatory subunit [Clostridia bacterium]